MPTTEILLTSKDPESNSLYSDLTTSEEFLASHVIRITSGQAPSNGSVRDSRGKAKQYTTINGRTVIVKESYVYSNKGYLGIIAIRGLRLADSRIRLQEHLPGTTVERRSLLS